MPDVANILKIMIQFKPGGNGQAGRRGGERRHFRDLGAEGAGL